MDVWKYEGTARLFRIDVRNGPEINSSDASSGTPMEFFEPLLLPTCYPLQIASLFKNLY